MGPYRAREACPDARHGGGAPSAAEGQCSQGEAVGCGRGVLGGSWAVGGQADGISRTISGRESAAAGAEAAPCHPGPMSGTPDSEICHVHQGFVMRSNAMYPSAVCIRVFICEDGGILSDREREILTQRVIMTAPVI